MTTQGPAVAIGTLTIKHYRRGKLIEIRHIRNLLTNVGLAEMAGLWIGLGTAFGYIAIGTGTTPAAETDTALATETHRAAATVSQDTTTVTDDTAKLVATFSFTASYSITESGVFNASTGGDLLCRAVFSAISVVDGDSLEFTWKIQQTRGT